MTPETLVRLEQQAQKVRRGYRGSKATREIPVPPEHRVSKVHPENKACPVPRDRRASRVSREQPSTFRAVCRRQVICLPLENRGMRGSRLMTATCGSGTMIPASGWMSDRCKARPVLQARRDRKGTKVRKVFKGRRASKVTQETRGLPERRDHRGRSELRVLQVPLVRRVIREIRVQ